MSFKDTFRLRIDRLAGQVGPLLEESWREARQRLDDLNQALASQAVPGERRARVSELGRPTTEGFFLHAVVCCLVELWCVCARLG